MKHMWMWTLLLMLGGSQKVYQSERGRGVDKKSNVAGNCAAINNFSIAISCVAPIILQWNNKNSIKIPSQTWLWKDYMTSSKETVSVKRIQIVECIQSCFSRHQLLLIWRKNTQNNSKSLEWIQKCGTHMNIWGWIFKIFTITNIIS